MQTEKGVLGAGERTIRAERGILRASEGTTRARKGVLRAGEGTIRVVRGFLIPLRPSTNFEIQKYYQKEPKFNVFSINDLPKIKGGVVS